MLCDSQSQTLHLYLGLIFVLLLSPIPYGAFYSACVQDKRMHWFYFREFMEHWVLSEGHYFKNLVWIMEQSAMQCASLWQRPWEPRRLWKRRWSFPSPSVSGSWDCGVGRWQWSILWPWPGRCAQCWVPAGSPPGRCFLQLGSVAQRGWTAWL